MAWGTFTRSTSVLVKVADPVRFSVPPPRAVAYDATKSTPTVFVSTELVKNCAVVTP